MIGLMKSLLILRSLIHSDQKHKHLIKLICRGLIWLLDWIVQNKWIAKTNNLMFANALWNDQITLHLPLVNMLQCLFQQIRLIMRLLFQIQTVVCNYLMQIKINDFRNLNKFILIKILSKQITRDLVKSRN